MAVNRRWTNRDGQPQEETTWFRVSVWGRQAETANQYLAKGRRVLAEGRISARAFIGNDGQPRASLELDARNLQFLSSRQEDAQEGASDRGPSDQNYSSGGGNREASGGNYSTSDYGSSGSSGSAPANNESSQEDEDDMDEIPF